MKFLLIAPVFDTKRAQEETFWLQVHQRMPDRNAGLQENCLGGYGQKGRTTITSLQVSPCAMADISRRMRPFVPVATKG